jgi:hypothetical protein
LPNLLFLHQLLLLGHHPIHECYFRLVIRVERYELTADGKVEDGPPQLLDPVGGCGQRRQGVEGIPDLASQLLYLVSESLAISCPPSYRDAQKDNRKRSFIASLLGYIPN